MGNRKGKLKEVAGLFLKLGFIAFDDPAVHIAMMEDEVVRKRKWMSRQHFLDRVTFVTIGNNCLGGAAL